LSRFPLIFFGRIPNAFLIEKRSRYRPESSQPSGDIPFTTVLSSVGGRELSFEVRHTPNQRSLRPRYLFALTSARLVMMNSLLDLAIPAHAFLMFNSNFEVKANITRTIIARRTKAAFPDLPSWGGGSFWMRRLPSKADSQRST
jgi:hypothetical protein